MKKNSLIIRPIISGITRPKQQIGHHHKQVRLVTQKTDLRSEKSRYQTQTVRQRTSKTPTQAKIFD